MKGMLNRNSLTICPQGASSPLCECWSVWWGEGKEAKKKREIDMETKITLPHSFLCSELSLRYSEIMGEEPLNIY